MELVLTQAHGKVLGEPTQTYRIEKIIKTITMGERTYYVLDVTAEGIEDPEADALCVWVSDDNGELSIRLLWHDQLWRIPDTEEIIFLEAVAKLKC